MANMEGALHEQILSEFQPEGRKLLVVLPCSATKPYQESRSQRLYRRTVSDATASEPRVVDFASLSAAHGLVPDRYTTESAALDYDLNMNRSSSLRRNHETPSAARSRVTALVLAFLKRFRDTYPYVVCYGRDNYRRVYVSLRAELGNRVFVLPSASSLRSQDGLRELRETVSLCLMNLRISK